MRFRFDSQTRVRKVIKNRPGSVLKAIQGGSSLQDSLNSDVTVSSFGDLIDASVVEEQGGGY